MWAVTKSRVVAFWREFFDEQAMKVLRSQASDGHRTEGDKKGQAYFPVCNSVS